MPSLEGVPICLLSEVSPAEWDGAEPQHGTTLSLVEMHIHGPVPSHQADSLEVTFGAPFQRAC